MPRKKILHLKSFTGARLAGALKIIHSIGHDKETTHTELHTHDYYEIVVILRGEGRHLLNDRTIPMHPGSIFILKPGELHRYVYNESISLINFMFSRRFLAKYKKDLSGLRGAQELLFCEDPSPELYAETTVISELDILFNRTADEMRSNRPEGNLLIELNILNALILILGCYCNPLQNLYKHHSGIEAAIAYMQQHFNEEIHLAELAKRTGMSASSFYRQFCQTFGKSPKQWLLELRIRKSCEFLLRSDKKVFEVASATGFTDALYFSRLFHKMTGFTPSEYRLREHGDLFIVHDKKQ